MIRRVLEAIDNESREDAFNRLEKKGWKLDFVTKRMRRRSDVISDGYRQWSGPYRHVTLITFDDGKRIEAATVYIQAPKHPLGFDVGSDPNRPEHAVLTQGVPLNLSSFPTANEILNEVRRVVTEKLGDLA